MDVLVRYSDYHSGDGAYRPCEGVASVLSIGPG